MQPVPTGKGKDREQNRKTQTKRNSSSSQLKQQERIESQRDIETQTFKKIAMKHNLMKVKYTEIKS